MSKGSHLAPHWTVFFQACLVSRSCFQAGLVLCLHQEMLPLHVVVQGQLKKEKSCKDHLKQERFAPVSSLVLRSEASQRNI